MKITVDIKYPTASVVKLTMESASSVNQDIGVTPVERTVVLGVQGIVRRGAECVLHA